MKVQIQEAQRTPSRITPPWQSYSNFRKSKIKRNILKQDGSGGRLPYKGAEVRIASDISETMQASKKRVQWSVQSVKGKTKAKHQLRILYPVKLSFMSEREILSDKIEGIYCQYMPTLQEMLESSSDRRKLYRWETQICIKEEHWRMNA